MKSTEKIYSDPENCQPGLQNHCSCRVPLPPLQGLALLTALHEPPPRPTEGSEERVSVVPFGRPVGGSRPSGSISLLLILKGQDVSPTVALSVTYGVNFVELDKSGPKMSL